MHGSIPWFAVLLDPGTCFQGGAQILRISYVNCHLKIGCNLLFSSMNVLRLIRKKNRHKVIKNKVATVIYRASCRTKWIDMRMRKFPRQKLGLYNSADMTKLCVRTSGPFFVSTFKPLGIIAAALMGIIFLADALYIGCWFYAVMWGKTKGQAGNKGNGSKIQHVRFLCCNTRFRTYDTR